jgi:hypothetical protein
LSDRQEDNFDDELVDFHLNLKPEQESDLDDDDVETLKKRKAKLELAFKKDRILLQKLRKSE